MNNRKKVQWDNFGKAAIIIFALAMALFFPFQKYLAFGKKKAVENKEQRDMTSALLEEESKIRDYRTDPEIYWRRDGDGYLLYVNGKQITGTSSSWSGEDLMLYDPRTEITYLLPNFKKVQDKQLRQGKVAKAGQR